MQPSTNVRKTTTEYKEHSQDSAPESIVVKMDRCLPLPHTDTLNMHSADGGRNIDSKVALKYCYFYISV